MTSWLWPNGYRRLLAVIATVVVVACLPPRPVFHAKPHVRVTALGSANDLSAAADIAILGIGSPARQQPFADQSRLPGGWMREGAAVVWRAPQASPAIAWSGGSTVDTVVTFATGSRAGRVRLDIDGDVRDLDLYAAADGAAIVAVRPGPASVMQFEALRLLELVGCSMLAWIACCLVIAGASRRGFPPEVESGGAHALVDKAFWKATIGYALPSLLAFGFSLLAFWPAQMSPDSVEEWRGAMAGEISDIHTILHSVLLWLCARISSSPSLPVAVQAIAVAIATGSVLAEARHWVRPAGALRGLSIAIALWPANFTLATVLWKDVVAAAGLLFLLSATMMLVRTRGAALSQRGFRAFLVLSALVAGLSRHNLLPLLFVLPLAMFACYRHLPWRWIATAAVPMAAVPILLKFLVIPAFGVPTLFAHYRAINAMHVIGAYVQAGKPGLDDQQRALVASVMPETAWRQRYDCKSVVPLFFGPQTSFEILAARHGDLNRLALDLIASSPLIAFEHQACATNMLWKILPRGQSLVSTAPMAIADMAESRQLGLEMRPPIPAVRQVVDGVVARTGKGTVSWIFWRPALPLLLLSLATLAAALAMNRPDVCLLALPAWINTATLGLVMGAPDYRYQYGVVLVGLMLFVILMLPERHGRGGEAGTLSDARQTG